MENLRNEKFDVDYRFTRRFVWESLLKFQFQFQIFGYDVDLRIKRRKNVACAGSACCCYENAI